MIGLRDGISFCEADGRLIFLDIYADRYIALQPATESAFRRLVDGKSDLSKNLEVQRLLHRGFLVESSANLPPSASGAPPTPQESLLDDNLPDVSVGALLGALSGLAHTRLQLRVRGLASLLRRVSACKARHSLSAPPEGILEGVAAAFQHSALMTRSHDQCLVRSAAAACRLAALGATADLVIGVRARPFSAHCWLQSADRLVNDRCDVVRAYTPILVL